MNQIVSKSHARQGRPRVQRTRDRDSQLQQAIERLRDLDKVTDTDSWTERLDDYSDAKEWYRQAVESAARGTTIDDHVVNNARCSRGPFLTAAATSSAPKSYSYARAPAAARRPVDVDRG